MDELMDNQQCQPKGQVGFRGLQIGWFVDQAGCS